MPTVVATIVKSAFIEARAYMSAEMRRRSTIVKQGLVALSKVQAEQLKWKMRLIREVSLMNELRRRIRHNLAMVKKGLVVGYQSLFIADRPRLPMKAYFIASSCELELVIPAKILPLGHRDQRLKQHNHRFRLEFVFVIAP